MQIYPAINTISRHHIDDVAIKIWRHKKPQLVSLRRRPAAAAEAAAAGVIQMPLAWLAYRLLSVINRLTTDRTMKRPCRELHFMPN